MTPLTGLLAGAELEVPCSDEKTKAVEKRDDVKAEEAPEEGEKNVPSREQSESETRRDPDAAAGKTAVKKEITEKSAPVLEEAASAKVENGEASVTHPNPKNFAERLMFALEKGMGSDVINWQGEGRAVAIHPKKLKKDPILEDHFRVKNYGAFIRNCNRW